MSRAITGIHPLWAVPGARIQITGVLPMPAEGQPHVLVGTHDARVVAASPTSLRVVVPSEAQGGKMAVRIDELPGESAFIDVGRVFAIDVHQVDSPVFDGFGRLWATHSGSRDSRSQTPLYRIGRDGAREALAVDIANPTSLAIGPDHAVYASSRFDGRVYRIGPNDHAEIFVAEVGVPTGLAFSPDGSLFVGDRSGSIMRVSPGKHVETFATLPASVAAFHLAFGPDGALYVTAPTMATHDPVYRITLTDRVVETVCDGFGRPQGLAFDSTGALYVVDALAGAAGLYRVDLSRSPATPELVATAPSLVGVAIDPHGGLALASNDTIWRLDVPITPLTFAR